MKIAQILKPWDSVPPLKYGGIQRIVKYLADELLKAHRVTVFAPRPELPWDHNNLDIVSLFDINMKDRGHDRNLEAAQMIHALEHISKSSEKFDILHTHSLDTSLLVSGFIKQPLVYTVHHKPNLATELLMKFAKNVHFVFVSESLSKLYAWIDDPIVIHNGIPVEEFPFVEYKENYLMYVGAITFNKGLHTAIKVAKEANIPLIIAGKVRDEDYFIQYIHPHIDGESIKYVGEVGDEERNKLLGNSIGMLFPLVTEEPFPTVIMESLVVGTPVIAFNKGSVSEIINDSETGFLVADEEEMLEKIHLLRTISPKDCRDSIEKRFTSQIMAQKYIDLYSKIV
jgi:glycosyltransferase involved in cell wall biosynthesis